MNADVLLAPLHRIVYISRRVASVEDDEVIDGIVLRSISNNRRLDITGCLWFDASWFVQVLEGPKVAVLDLMDRIMLDPRHYAVDVLLSEDIEARRIARFSMRTLHTKPLAMLAGVLERRAAPPTRGEAGGAAADTLIAALLDELVSLAGT